MVALDDLWRLAEEFDRRSREAGELYSTAEFLSWASPSWPGWSAEATCRSSWT